MNNLPRQKESIIIADTQAVIVEGLKTLLKDHYSITGIVTSGQQLMEALTRTLPAIVIMDFFLLDFDSYDDLRTLRKNFPDVKIIIFTNSLVKTEMMEYYNCGIRNILHKSADTDELYECIESAIKGRKHYSGVILDLLFEPGEKKNQNTRAVQITPAEIEIIRLIAEGLTNKEIAAKKYLSIHTIMTHRKNILRKLGLSNASELVMYAVKSGLIDNIEYHI